MKLFSIILLILPISSWSQTDIVETEITTSAAFELSVIQVYPDSFPQVSVVFQAKDGLGSPLWLLDKSELGVIENGYECEIETLFNISNNKPLNIGIVFDHSSSMIENPSQLPDNVKSFEEYFALHGSLPEDYKMAITFAKEGVNKFLDQEQSLSDSILFVGFSSTVDMVLPLTNDISLIKHYVNILNANGSTAFYDALYLAVDSLSEHATQTAIVALTDGQDNTSIKTYKEVIEHAKKQNIAIYVIGLGDVNKKQLKNLAQSTKGFFYYTNDPNALGEIYSLIKDQLRSIYQLDYNSNATDYANPRQNLEFYFVNDTLSFSNNSTWYDLPIEALEYLKQQEARLKEIRNRSILLAGLGGIVLLGIGGFMIYRRKEKKAELNASKLIPNPFDDKVTIEYDLPPNTVNTQLNIFDSSGKLIRNIALDGNSNTITIDVSQLEREMHIFEISASGYKHSLKGIKK